MKGKSAVLLLFVGMFLNGCLMAGNYHSAKTLEPRESSFGMTFSLNEISISDHRYTVPNVIPELAYHVGVAKNWEVGGRVAIGSLGIEMDTKYRFLHQGNLHLAVAPAAAYQAIFVVRGVSVRLPLILSYDLTDNFGFNASVLGGFSVYDAEKDNDYDNSYDYARYFNGQTIFYGASFGPELRGSVFFVRPAVEFIRYQTSTESDNDPNWEPFNSINFLVHFGWVFGREKQQLDRIENKLDKSLEQQ
ncbi:MAG: hypothetical protein NT056_02970 [Proteobacteria bacterium]|nr:hypothetical protein [Pseudomonadota bacterium]